MYKFLIALNIIVGTIISPVPAHSEVHYNPYTGKIEQGTGQKYNPYTTKYESTYSDSRLTYNQRQQKYELARTNNTRYNPYTSKYEPADRLSRLTYNPRTSSYEYTKKP
jgi:hypothetical protein